MSTDRTLVVPTDATPTFFNRDAAMWFFIASIPGLIIGGLLGKQRMEREREFGKMVSPPTFWNKSLVIGAGVGGIVAGLATLGLILLSMPVVTGPALLATAMANIGAIEIMHVLGMAFGALVGAEKGKHRLAAEYDQALAMQATNEAHEKSGGPSKSYSISHGEAKDLETRLSTGKQSFADSMAMQEPSTVQR